jgi:hypothetical protein
MLTTTVADPTLANVSDVRAWFDALHDVGISFHPEDCFTDIADRETGEPDVHTCRGDPDERGHDAGDEDRHRPR